MANKLVKKLKAFNFKDPSAGGPIRVGLNGFLDLDNITLLARERDYLINIEYSPKEKKYSFEVYMEKK